MLVSELIALVRERVDDKVEPYLVSDAQMIQFANTAQREACERGAVLFDSSTTGVCSYSVDAGAGTVILDPSILTILRAQYDGTDLVRIPAHGYAQLRARLRSASTPWGYLDIGGVLHFYPPPQDAGTLTLEVYRYPLADLESTDDEPEIPARDHVYLAHWMTWEAASLWDEAGDGVYDPELAKRELALFERRFGPARSATELRSWRELPRDTQTKPRYFA